MSPVLMKVPDSGSKTSAVLSGVSEPRLRTPAHNDLPLLPPAISTRPSLSLAAAAPTRSLFMCARTGLKVLRRRIVHLRGVVRDVAAGHAAAAATGDQHFADAEQGGDVRDARLIQMAGAAERAARRVVNLGAASRLDAVGAAAHDSTRPSRSIVAVCPSRGVDIEPVAREGAAAGIVDLGAGELRTETAFCITARRAARGRREAS